MTTKTISDYPGAAGRIAAMKSRKPSSALDILGAIALFSLLLIAVGYMCRYAAIQDQMAWELYQEQIDNKE